MHFWRPLLALAALLAVACQGPQLLSPQQGGILINKTTAGMRKEELLEKLGPPHKQETYGPTEFLFYNTNWIMVDAAKQRSPVVIVRGKVVGFGNGYYEAFIKSQTEWKGEVGVALPEWSVATKLIPQNDPWVTPNQ